MFKKQFWKTKIEKFIYKKGFTTVHSGGLDLFLLIKQIIFADKAKFGTKQNNPKQIDQCRSTCILRQRAGEHDSLSVKIFVK